MNFKSHLSITKKLFRLFLIVWMILFYLGAGNLSDARAAGVDFKLVFIPDTQFESESYPQVFNSITTWIVSNQVNQNIVFASHMGDIVQTSTNTNEWVNASSAMSILDNAQFPYSVGPGNHDSGDGYINYNKYFGVSHFAGKPTYVGHYGTDNNNNYSLFSASGLDFILINLQYEPTSAILDWADALFKQYNTRRGILVSHEILDDKGALASDGSEIVDALKDNPNLFLMMCGHAGVEYLAEQGTDGHTIHIMMADYEGKQNGGNGYIRILTFSPANDKISATTYSTYDGSSITSYPDQMDMAYNMHDTTGAFNKTGPLNGATNMVINPTLTWGTNSTATSYEYCFATTSGCSSFTSVGLNTSVVLSGLNNSQTYYWQVRAITPNGTIPADSGNYWSFTTIVAAPGAFAKTSPTDGATVQPTSLTLSWGVSTGATSYDYCYSTSNPCSNWKSAGMNTSVSLSLSGSTSYYWQVRAVNAGGTTYANGVTTDWSFTTSATPPGAFAKTSPANNAPDQPINLTLTWGTSSNASLYEYCYGISNPCSNWTSSGTNTSASLTGLSKNTTYYWQVRASNAGGTTYANGVTTDWSFTTIVAAPGTFSKVSPLDGTSGLSTTPTLTWGASDQASSYEYCYGITNPCSNWTTAGSNTSISLSGLGNNTTYYWQVRAVNAGGTAYANGMTTDWSFTTAPLPGSFSKNSPVDNASNQTIDLTLTWDTSSNASSYEYCYATTTPCSNWTTTNATSANISGLSNSTRYYWQVRAISAGGITIANGGAYWSFTTIMSAPGGLNKTSPADNASSQPTSLALRWSTSSGAASYEYCYGTDNPCSNWVSNSTTSAFISGLNNNTTYYWQVRAINGGGTIQADGGIFWSFTTIIAAPGAFKKTGPVDGASGSATNPTLTWGTSDRAASYEYCIGIINPCSNWVSAGTDTSVTLAGLENSQVYYWQVRAINAGGTMLADSGTLWSFTTIMAVPAAFSKTNPLDGDLSVTTHPTLSWGTSERAESYEYCYAISTGCTNWASTGLNSSVTLYGLIPGQTYYWQVRAINLGGITLADLGTYWSFDTIVYRTFLPLQFR
jgi:hypothetical protein